MELSPEDSLRLNVLLANARAIRIDEGSMCVIGLCREGEARVELNPTGSPERYLRAVRELLSQTVLGSPRGYPVFLRRWARMGQVNSSRLENLLMLGEPEAVVAVACSPGLTEELAQRVWWSLPTAEIARYLLQHETVARSDLGKTLAEFLVEFLPFESEHSTIGETVRLVLQPGLLDDTARDRLWAKGRRRRAYYVGFMQAVPDCLPQPLPDHPLREMHRDDLEKLALEGNPYVRQLDRVLRGTGQRFVHTGKEALSHAADQDVLVSVLEALGDYFSFVRPAGEPATSIEAIQERMERLWAATEAGGDDCDDRLRRVRRQLPGIEAQLRALVFLSQVGEPLVRGILARTTAVGALMRRKLEPVTGPILEQLSVLDGRAGSVPS